MIAILIFSSLTFMSSFSLAEEYPEKCKDLIKEVLTFIGLRVQSSQDYTLQFQGDFIKATDDSSGSKQQNYIYKSRIQDTEVSYFPNGSNSLKGHSGPHFTTSIRDQFGKSIRITTDLDEDCMTTKAQIYPEGKASVTLTYDTCQKIIKWNKVSDKNCGTVSELIPNTGLSLENFAYAQSYCNRYGDHFMAKSKAPSSSSERNRGRR